VEKSADRVAIEEMIADQVVVVVETTVVVVLVQNAEDNILCATKN
jgi:hypothetical protein